MVTVMATSRAGAVLAAFVAAIATGCSLLPGQATIDEAATAYERCRTDPPEGGPVQVVVWLNPEAPAGDVEVVADALERIPTLSEVEYIGPEQTFHEFDEYYADQPEVLELIEPEQLPTSFRAMAVDAASLDAVKAELERYPSVRDVERGTGGVCTEQEQALVDACDGDDPRRFRLWLEPGAPPDAVDAALAAGDQVADHRYIGPDGTEAEFRAAYSGDDEAAELVESVDVEQLPTSFAVTLRRADDGLDDEAAGRFLGELEALPDVRDVERDRSGGDLAPSEVCGAHWTLTPVSS
ncbi:MAG: permease-like cell division protein FtsX [Actinomycetota bacterium]